MLSFISPISEPAEPGFGQFLSPNPNSELRVKTQSLTRLFFVVFFKINFFINNSKTFSNTIRVINGLDPDQDRRYVGPDLGPNCLQILSADDNSRQRVNRRGFRKR